MAETFEDLQARANKLHSALAQKSFMKRAFESTSQAGSEKVNLYFFPAKIEFQDYFSR